MIHHLDGAIERLLRTRAPADSLLRDALQTDISFEIPDPQWRDRLERLTVNCYLYAVRENATRRTHQPMVVRGPNGGVSQIEPPRRIDCAYVLTAWSVAVQHRSAEEHRLLSEAMMVLLRHPTLPADVLGPDIDPRLPPHPTTVLATPGDRDHADFWRALDQYLKPSLDFVVTLAVLVEAVPADDALGPAFSGGAAVGGGPVTRIAAIGGNP